MIKAIARTTHQTRWRQWNWLFFITLSAVALSGCPAKDEAVDLPPANKMIALVRAENCQLDAIKPQVIAAGEALLQNEATTRVAVHFAANPENNIDMLGNAADYIASVEAAAPISALPEIEDEIESVLGSQCRFDIYTVHERRIVAPARTWELGQATPGVKGYRFLYRKEETTLEFFNEEWAGPHAEMVLGDDPQAERRPGMRYIHNLVLARANEGSPPFDGIAEEGGLNRGAPDEESIKSAQAISAAAPDEVRDHAEVFLDMGRIGMFETQEIILKD